MRNKNVFIPAAAGITLILATMLFAGENPMDLIKKNQGLGKELGIKLDGKLTEPLWQKAKKYEPFYFSCEQEPASVQTTGLFAYDNLYLYFGFICQEPNITNLTQKAKVNDLSRIYGDDSIEVEIDSNRGGRNGFYRIAVNSLGYYGAFFYPWYTISMDVETDCLVGINIEKDKWMVELAVPFSSLAMAGGLTEEIGIIFFRNRVAGAKREESCSSKINDLHSPGDFHVVALTGIDRSPYLLNINPYPTEIILDATRLMKKGDCMDGVVTFSIENISSKPRSPGLDYIVYKDDATNIPGQIKNQDISILPKEKKRVELPVSVHEAGKYKFLLCVKENAKLSANITYPLEVKFNLLTLAVISPFYRNNIYSSQKINEIKARIDTGLSIEEIKGAEIGLSFENDQGKVLASKNFNISNIGKELSLPISSLSTGKYILKASLRQKERILAQTEQIINKLPPAKTGEVWLDEGLNWHIDGKPFFLNGHWGYEPGKNPYFNLYYGNLNAAERERGVKTMPASARNTGWNLSKEETEIFRRGKINDEILSKVREIVKKEKDNPDLFCYHLCDEPDGSRIPVENMKAVYEIVKEEDPYHPAWITCMNIDGAREYEGCADFILRDIYPKILKEKRINDFSIIANGIDDFVRFTNYRKPVGLMHQGFNYGDDGWGTRAPTYIELRDQNLLALTVGAKCVIQFNLDVGFGDYPEYDIGIPHLAQELAYLGKAVMAPVSKLEVKTSSDKVRTLLKDGQGELYLFAVNADMEPRDVRITIPGISKRAKDLNVIPEGRAVGIKNDTFTDKFDTFEAHVYTTSKEETGLMSVKEVCKKIEAVQQARRKPGNLAFQMYKGDGVTVTASSGGGPRLWHLVDGIMNSKRTIWVDKTPNEYPDWIEIKLPKAHSIGRVVVYPYDKSLKDYSVQAFIAGEWKEMDKISGNDKEMITHEFGHVVTDKIRLWITAANGPNSKIAEIEIYEK